MKPTRNRYFCNEARRSKMLFESESQANNFIKFNAGEMEELGGKVPVRSYFCAFCNGWHVTSNPNAEFFENHPSKAEIVLESIIQERKKRDESKVERLLKKGEEMNEQGLFKDACRFYINCYHSLNSDSTK